MKTIQLESEAIAPSKIVCIGRNYLAHIKELGNETPDEMVIFNKPNSSVSTQLHASRDGETLHYEGEICFIVGDAGLRAVGFGLDLTRRKLQSKLKAKGLPWERAKAFDGAACFSDFVVLGDIELESLSLQLEINGELCQEGGYELMMHKPDQILDGIQQFMTLENGDIIMTGTPQGVGQVQTGDHFAGRIKSGSRLLVSQEWRAE
ncbi:MAG: fumarylacetoacetate hydrolase family protein [Gammaproteobacteria bacterium]|nr:fumarylacetoacetate hydrolase family protein [Gammaproteobacteria bacterium]